MATNNINNNVEIPRADFVQKGDLLIGTGSGTYIRVPVRADGMFLVADSNETSGVKWQVNPEERAYIAGGSTGSLSNSIEKFSNETVALITAVLSISRYFLVGSSLANIAYYAGGVNVTSYNLIE